MNVIQSFYKTKNLANRGFFILASLAVLLLAGRLLIPEFEVKSFDKQIYTLKGIAFKYNDRQSVSHFLRSIKFNNGYLCLGTSETTQRANGNYHNFLNNDPEIPSRFSLLYGAGRTCGKHIPMLLHHREEVDSLKIIYMINPIYWRTGHHNGRLEYWNRYSNYRMCKNVKLTQEERTAYFPTVEDFFDKLNLLQKATSSLEYWLRESRKNYFQNLRYYFNPEEYDKKIKFIRENKTDLTNYDMFGQIDYENIDTTWNVLRSLVEKKWFNPINENANYRFEELKSFIVLCRDLGIEATFVIGPYNGRFIENKDKESLEAYVTTIQKIKQILIEEEASYIDATDISFVIGAFRDHQHHSSYGAYLIYNKIKLHLYEKDSI